MKGEGGRTEGVVVEVLHEAVEAGDKAERDPRKDEDDPVATVAAVNQRVLEEEGN